MVNQEVIKYVKESLSKGVSLDEIKKNLRASGWSDAEINEAVSAGSSGGSAKAMPSKNIWIIIGIVIAIIAVAAAVIYVFSSVKPEPVLPTCLEAGGYECSSDKICEGDLLDASDSSRCCSETCVTPCVESWTCTNWTTCVNRTQTKNCTDSNNCGTTTDRPTLTNVCGNQTYNQTNLTIDCSAGNECNLNCTTSGGDADCTCEEQGQFLSKNVSYIYRNSGQVCNGTVVIFLNDTYYTTTRTCCIGNAVIPRCDTNSNSDGFCKLNCPNGDYDCSCPEQQGTLCAATNYTNACGTTYDFIMSYEFLNRALYCCKPYCAGYVPDEGKSA